MADKIFVGFSTNEDSKRIGRSWALYDADLITRDLLNHFYTRKGERVMRPDFGCSIWDMIMEPMSLAMREEIAAEVKRICDLETRVILEECRVQHSHNAIVCTVTLTYLPSRTTNEVMLTFDRRQEF